MRIIRHLSGQLLLLCVTAVLTTAIWLTQSLRFISIIVLQGVAFSTFLGLMLWILPDLILLALPVGFLVSVLFLYNKAIAEHEFVILKTAGCSNLFLLRPIFWVGGWGGGGFFISSKSLSLTSVSPDISIKAIMGEGDGGLKIVLLNGKNWKIQARRYGRVTQNILTERRYS